MKFSIKITGIFLICISFYLFFLIRCQVDTGSVRHEEDFNFDWKFHLGNVPEASNVDFDASDWQNVRLPHDWSV